MDHLTRTFQRYLW